MARKSRKRPKVELQQARVFGELKNVPAINSISRMTYREMEFARLVACESFTFTEAYKEAFQPETTNQDSINVMASRMAKRPRVASQMDRLRLDERLNEERCEAEKRHQDSLPSLLRDGNWLGDQVLKGLYTLAVSSEDDKTRVKCWELLGKSKHADVFKSAGSFVQVNDPKTQNVFQIPDTNDPDELRGELMKRLTGIIDIESK